MTAIRSAIQPAIRAAISGVYGSSSAWSPLTLFAASEVGVWYDPSDFSTMFQDSAGATPVTAVGQPVGKILDKSGNGKHATQATAASRPILGRTPATGQRNLLTYTEQFDNAYWTKGDLLAFGSGSTANAVNAPDGTLTADYIRENTANQPHRIVLPNLSLPGTHTVSAYFKAGERSYAFLGAGIITQGAGQIFNLSTGALGESRNVGTSVGTSTITSVGSGWYRCSLSVTNLSGTTNVVCAGFSQVATGATWTGFQPMWTGDGTSGIYVWGAQLELGSSATAYQKVAAAYDVTEAGVADCYNLYFDGVDDSLATAAIDFTATDAVGVFAGIRKASDAARGTIVELTVSAAANNGSFHLAAPNAASATIAWESKGTVLADAVAASGVAAPLTAVLTGTSDISGDTAILRVNGAQADADAGDQGTGNFSNAAMYIGRRGGSSLPFNGRIHSLVVLGRTATALEIAAAESYVAGKSGVTL